jgi:hypothetical protein
VEALGRVDQWVLSGLAASRVAHVRRVQAEAVEQDSLAEAGAAVLAGVPDPLHPQSAEEVPLNWSKRIRQTHRWLSIAFVGVVVIVTILATGEEEPAEWVFLSPLLPLFLLSISGLYLFVLPYASRWRSGRRTD